MQPTHPTYRDTPASGLASHVTVVESGINQGITFLGHPNSPNCDSLVHNCDFVIADVSLRSLLKLLIVII